MVVATTFFKTSSRRFPEDVLNISLRRLKTSSRLFLAKAKGHQETIYGPSMYALNYKHITTLITRHTNWINLNKQNPLKHENNMEFMKTCFPMKCQTRIHSLHELKNFSNIGVLQTVVLLSPNKAQLFFPNKRTNLSPLLTDVFTRFHALHNFGADAAGNREIIKPVRTLVSNRLNHPWI